MGTTRFFSRSPCSRRSLGRGCCGGGSSASVWVGPQGPGATPGSDGEQAPPARTHALRSLGMAEAGLHVRCVGHGDPERHQRGSWAGSESLFGMLPRQPRPRLAAVRAEQASRDHIPRWTSTLWQRSTPVEVSMPGRSPCATFAQLARWRWRWQARLQGQGLTAQAKRAPGRERVAEQMPSLRCALVLRPSRSPSSNR